MTNENMTGLDLDTGEKNKFMFDLHIFDEPEMEEPEEDAPPPPPTYSEDELKNEKSSSFEQGRAQGIAESTESREQKVAELLEQIAGEARSLFAQEEQREKIFEVEAVRLNLVIFQKLFPFYHERNGFAELEAAVSDIIRKQEAQARIQIEVSPGQCEGIRAHVQNLGSYGLDAQKFSVTANEGMPDGSCKLSWADGGAVRDIQAMADQIKGILQDMLAGNGTTSHDEGDVAQSHGEAEQQNEDALQADKPAEAEDTADVNDETMETKQDE